MADALCGPSNSLQSFQKHASIDRTLQQDRVVSRQTPLQGFRTPNPNAGILDAEYEAFVAGEPVLEPLDPPHAWEHRQAPAVQLGILHQEAPDWAMDFQNLHVDQTQVTPIPSTQFRQQAPLQRSSPGPWQHDFMQNHQPQSFRSSQYQQSSLGHATTGYAMSAQQFGPYNQQYNTPELAQQSENRLIESFDEEAFGKAFDQANLRLQYASDAGATFDLNRFSEETIDDILRECYIAAYEIKSIEDVPAVNQEQMNSLDFHAKTGWIKNLHSRLKDRHDYTSISERLARLQNPHNKSASQEVNNVPKEKIDYRIGSDMILDESLQRQGESSEAREADELAKTAGQLLENVKHDQSTKFQESNFLSLMRQLRDKEVKVKGDTIVNIKQPLHPGGPGYPNGIESLPANEEVERPRPTTGRTRASSVPRQRHNGFSMQPQPENATSWLYDPSDHPDGLNLDRFLDAPAYAPWPELSAPAYR